MPTTEPTAPTAGGDEGVRIAAAFYHFADLPDHGALRGPLAAECRRRSVLGTILLAPEGINGTIAGAPEGVRAVLDFLRGDPRLAALVHKESPAGVAPFRRLKVRLKREIVSMGVDGVDAAGNAGRYVRPEDWNALLDDPEVLVIDARNDYEFAVGHFRGAVDPGTNSFRELPDWLDRQDIGPDTRVAMYCTGGIRCEKSTAYLRERGVEQVYHLRGGILAYLESVAPEESRWEGECFVFDERVAVGHALAPGTHVLCRACRRPLSEAQTASPRYRPGVSCPHCHDSVTDARRQRFAERQKQMELAEARGEAHLAVRRPGAGG